MYLSLYYKGSKRLFKVLWWEGVGDRTELQYIGSPLLWPSTLCLSRSPELLNRRPRGPALCWMVAFFTASYHQLVWSPTHWGPEGPFGLAWLSLTPSPTVWLLSWPSHTTAQRPLDRPLNLWNGMFDRHQAEITAMQPRGHSLPVNHSEVGLSPCLMLSAKLTCAISSHNCHWNVSLPSGASLWMAFLAGSKVKIQHWNFGKCEALLHCHRSHVHSGSGVLAPDRTLSMG